MHATLGYVAREVEESRRDFISPFLWPSEIAKAKLLFEGSEELINARLKTSKLGDA